MWDVACLGELFIDLTPHSCVDGQWLYAPSPGGAPGNVAVGLAKLGRKSLMISRVGDEAFGRLVVDALQVYGVDTSGVMMSADEKTGLSVVTLGAGGERSFMFYHDRPADLNMDAAHISSHVLKRCKVLHVGVLPLSAPRSAAAQRKAMTIADAEGLLISCDVNFRPNLWSSSNDMLEAGREILARAAIVKVSEEELRALDGSKDMDASVQRFWHEGSRAFSVTRGDKGAVLYVPAGRFECGGFAVNAVDTTGAGDAYTASLLCSMLAGDDPAMMVRKACAAGALAATQKGAMESLPTAVELAAFLSEQS